MNISSNISRTLAWGDPVKPAIVTFQIVLSIIIALVAFIGNALICHAVLNHGRRKVSEYFIFNLAITDVAVGVISIPFDLAELFLNRWPFGAVLCNVVYPLQTVLMSVSVTTLLCMSLERHRAITSPLKPRILAKQAILAIAFTWVFSVALVSPYAAILRYEGDHCLEAWPSVHHVKAFTLTTFILLYLVPLSVIAFAYIRIGQKLRQDSRSIQSALGYNLRGFQLAEKRTIKNQRIIRLFVIAVLAFAVTMLPVHIMWLWHDFGSGQSWSPFWNTLVFCNLLNYSNSTMNPFIFGSVNKRYRGSCVDTFRVLEGSRILSRSNTFTKTFYKKLKKLSFSGRSENSPTDSKDCKEDEDYPPFTIVLSMKSCHSDANQIIITAAKI